MCLLLPWGAIFDSLSFFLSSFLPFLLAGVWRSGASACPGVSVPFVGWGWCLLFWCSGASACPGVFVIFPEWLWFVA